MAKSPDFMPSSQGAVRSLTPVIDQMAGRLQQAVRRAGGNQSVATRAGVPLATVNNYVRGRNGMKIETLAALAETCGVSLDWLATGEAPGWGLAEPAAASPAVPRALDLEMLTKAIEVVEAVAGVEAFRDNPAELARRIASAYAVLARPEPEAAG